MDFLQIKLCVAISERFGKCIWYLKALCKCLGLLYFYFIDTHTEPIVPPGPLRLSLTMIHLDSTNITMITVGRHVLSSICYGPVSVRPYVCPSVRLFLSVTSQSSVKTAKDRITQTVPHDSRGV